ncbi:MAG: aminotransferase class IV [Brevundimonas sp.]|uniref:aminotransferase class IV n=1 Tax=Brevundimonas sp. TaxID=1871086 RepID=UPI0025C5DC25|nr:aminotransferase class IV [Brevundimonas sp.]MBX3477831.1 aminotransferase class IV [Brevundimonas sp.]
MTSLFIDGRPATADDLAHQALVNYGAYTSFAVTDGGVRGLDRHLARLRDAAVELFGEAVAEDQARAWMRQALGERRGAWMRVSLFAPEIGVRTPDWTGRPRMMVGVFDPAAPLSDTPVRLQPQAYGREAPHLKHAATFGLIRARRMARAAGFDDALFVDASGRISEASVSNIGFLSGDRIVWPQAPMLGGVSQALISAGLETETRPLTMADLPAFDGAFLTNSATPACAVAGIGDHPFATSPRRVADIAAAWRAAPPQPV